MSFCSNLFVNFKHFIHLLSCFSTITGTRIGTVIGLPLAGVLCASDLWGGWPSVFYIYGMYIYSPVCIWNWLIMVIDRMESTLVFNHKSDNGIGQLQNRRQFCSSQVWLQTGLDDTKSCYQLIITMKKFEKENKHSW